MAFAGEAGAPLALVTGGCRRLGARIAAALAQAGYSLALHGSKEAVPDDNLAVVLEQEQSEWHGFAADFEEPHSPTDMMERVVAHFGRVPDLLVNSAALFGQDRLENVTAQVLARHQAVNCAAPVLLSQSMANFARREQGEAQRPGRCIINILDQRLAHPHGDQLSYTMSKQALAGFTLIAARELAGLGIRVNAVAPGLTIATADYDAGQMLRLAKMMPLGRLPAPSQVADAVLYLARAAAVTGQTITVDGGAHLEGYSSDFMSL